MLSKTDILGSVYDKLKEMYPYPVYLDDVKRNFDVPCFFLKLITLRSAEKDYRFKCDCTLYISYIPDENEDAEEALKVRDTIDDAFWRGFKVKDRFLHVSSIDHHTIGENSDIIEMSLLFVYYDTDETGGVTGGGDNGEHYETLHISTDITVKRG